MDMINKVIYRITACLFFSGLLACNQSDMFKEEQYKKVLYVLSDDNMAFQVVHSLNETESTGYLTLYAGGTLDIDQDITFTLEPDEELLGEYNLLNYDLDTNKYAKRLDPSKYTIESYSVTMKQGGEMPYALLPIKIRPEGLSPDSLYMIPLKLTGVSAYEINPKKNRVLYQVVLENDFASEKDNTLMSMRGTRQVGDGPVSKIAANKRMYPLSKQEVRINAGMENSGNKADLELINKYSVIVKIGEEKTLNYKGVSYYPLTVYPYNKENIQVEMLGSEEDKEVLTVVESNRYGEELGIMRFHISYRYRTLVTPASEGLEAEWSDWVVVTENMKQLAK